MRWIIIMLVMVAFVGMQALKVAEALQGMNVPGVASMGGGGGKGQHVKKNPKSNY